VLEALADALVVLHVAFVVFATVGGLAVLRWRRLAWLHALAFAWAVTVELTGWICPLTPLEDRLRRSAGEAGYHGGFVAHYLIPTLYPVGLSRAEQVVLGLGVLALNAAIYAVLIAGAVRRRQDQ
jgi:Protein of Unknown function (DUF2784)